jgi:hypothetical protein
MNIAMSVLAFILLKIGVAQSFRSLGVVGHRHQRIRNGSFVSAGRSFTTHFKDLARANRDTMSPASRLEASKSSSESMPPAKGFEPVWVQLFIRGEVVGIPQCLSFGTQSQRTMASLSRLVKKECSDDLVGIPATRLEIHDSKDQHFLTVLDPSDLVSDLYGGDSPHRPILVNAIQNKRRKPSSTAPPPSLDSVWVQLYMNNEAVGDVARVPLPKDAEIWQLRPSLQAKFQNTLAETYTETSPETVYLNVYAHYDRECINSLPSESPVRVNGVAQYGGDSMYRPITVRATRNPESTLKVHSSFDIFVCLNNVFSSLPGHERLRATKEPPLPPDVERFAWHDYDFANFAKVARDIYYTRVDVESDEIVDNSATWARSPPLDNFAISLIGHERALLAMEQLLQIEGLEKTVDRCTMVDHCTARHLGAGVVALELSNNPLEDLATLDSTGTVVLSQVNHRYIVRKAIEGLKTRYSVMVIGHPGKGCKWVDGTSINWTQSSSSHCSACAAIQE